MSQQLSFTRGDSGQVVVSGDLDRNSVPAAWSGRQQWLPQSGHVTVDLAGVNHVDSAGLALLIRIKSQLDAGGQSLFLHNVNQQLQQFARVSGVEELLSLS